jgi:hypothetical protein
MRIFRLPIPLLLNHSMRDVCASWKPLLLLVRWDKTPSPYEDTLDD